MVSNTLNRFPDACKISSLGRKRCTSPVLKKLRRMEEFTAHIYRDRRMSVNGCHALKIFPDARKISNYSREITCHASKKLGRESEKNIRASCSV